MVEVNARKNEEVFFFFSIEASTEKSRVRNGKSFWRKEVLPRRKERKSIGPAENL